MFGNIEERRINSTFPYRLPWQQTPIHAHQI